MKKSTYILIIAIFIFIALGLWHNSVMSTNNKEINPESMISIERLDSSIENDDGVTMAVIYYDMPVIEGESEATLRINDFFETEYKLWLSDAPCRFNNYLNSMETFLDILEVEREYWGDEIIGVQPFQYKVDSEVVFLSDDILSIKQTVYIAMTGPSGTMHFGSTFDLNTGERIPFTEIVDIQADEFRSCLADGLISNNQCDIIIEQINRFYGPNEENDFALYYDRNIYQLNYEYFYDGENFYFDEMYGIGKVNSAEMIKWNGKTGEDFHVELFEWENYTK